MIIRNSCKINHSTHPCGHSNIKFYGHTNTKAQGSFPYSNRTWVSKMAHFIKSYKHPSPFGIWENLSLRSPSRCTLLFFKPFCVLICEFSKENCRSFLFQKHVSFSLLLLFVVFFFLEKAYNVGKIVTRDYTYQTNKRCVNK